MKEEKKYELIEGYIQGNLSEEEKNRFEQNLKENKSLRTEFDLHKSLHNEFADDVLDLKTKLNAITSESPLKIEKTDLKRSMPLIYKIISIAAVFLLAIIFLPNLLNQSLNVDEVYASYYEPYPMALNQRSISEDDRNILLNEAVQSYLDKNYTTSYDKFDALYAEDPDDIYLLYQASSKQANKELSTAIDLYNKVIANGDTKYIEQAAWYKALALLENGNKEQAKEAFEKMNSSHYNSAQIKKILKALK